MDSQTQEFKEKWQAFSRAIEPAALERIASAQRDRAVANLRNYEHRDLRRQMQLLIENEFSKLNFLQKKKYRNKGMYGPEWSDKYLDRFIKELTVDDISDFLLPVDTEPGQCLEFIREHYRMQDSEHMKLHYRKFAEKTGTLERDKEAIDMSARSYTCQELDYLSTRTAFTSSVNGIEYAIRFNSYFRNVHADMNGKISLAEAQRKFGEAKVEKFRLEGYLTYINNFSDVRHAELQKGAYWKMLGEMKINADRLCSDLGVDFSLKEKLTDAIKENITNMTFLRDDIQHILEPVKPEISCTLAYNGDFSINAKLSGRIDRLDISGTIIAPYEQRQRIPEMILR